ncbi:sensor histidine kinase [Marinobacterium sedimentorum]|uniref:sensor histidine kinase n=1 Tax=Marinobacterium sedimentorum TaxID=2927804 RepID=UPI0020C66518|nr:HAMP domain-containing sensor histidine kinase [Marinobacterium sedimentorum]MCP8688657.1 HAMP domain-containing histidine kinase [Marinobacterium sedimentorum]
MTPTHRWRAGSLRQLILLAFLLVVTPLGVLLLQASNELVEQARQGREQARLSLEISQRNLQLNVLAEDILRSARQYAILQRSDIRTRQQEQIGDYRNQLDIQSFLLRGNPVIPSLQETLGLIEQAQNGEIGLPLLEQLALLTGKLISASNLQLEQRLAELDLQARTTQQALWLLAAILIAVSALLMLFFSLRISRPVSQLIGRIRALGHGQPQNTAPLRGPRELVDLNAQLDWLGDHLNELEQEKQRFLRHISHELKTPLTTLREGSDLMAEEVAGPLTDNQREIIELIQRNSFELQTLIEQLLDYNRLQQPGPLDVRSTSLDSCLNAALHPHKLLLEQKQILLQRPTKDAKWPTDRAMLHRILSNLISNAIYYGDEQGKLSVCYQIQDGQMHIDIGNSGPTIPAAEIDQIFKPFFQGKNRRRGPLKGSGIGLSVAHDAAVALGARLYLAHNADHKVVFRIMLPAVNDSHAS